jgi:transposase
MTTEGATPLTPSTLLDAELAQLRQENELLHASARQSSQELELLRAQREQLLEQQKQSTRTIEQLQHQLQYLLRRIYGRSSEKIDPQQMLLFEKLLEQLAPRTIVERPASPEPTSPSPAQKGHGRRRLPADLPRRKVIHDLPEEEKTCPCCGQMRHVIGQEVSEQIDYVAPKVSVVEHVQLKYGCRHCEQQAAEGGPQITTAQKPLSPIEKGLAAPGLLAYVIVSKYSDHLPLHRLERILERYGIEIARSTMCDWMAQCAELLQPLHDRLVHYVRQSDVIHTDDTPVEVLDRNLDRTRTGRFWVYLGDPDHPYTVFTYTASRSRDGPMQFLKGWGQDRPVYLQADAFGGYDGIYAGQAGGRVTEVACWAHARRKFYEARSSDAAASTQALAYIRLLYDVEDQAREQFEEQGETAERRTLSAIRLALRQGHAVPRLEQFKTWLQSQQAQPTTAGLRLGGPVLPKSPMGQAITYALNQWEALCVYATNGRLAIDNNAAENALRRVAIGRKNWLFCGSDNGGHTAAILFSLIATCQRHKVEPFAYLRDVLTRIAATHISQLDQLLPDRWQAAQPDSTT